jgi:hypothetical protein
MGSLKFCALSYRNIGGFATVHTCSLHISLMGTLRGCIARLEQEFTAPFVFWAERPRGANCLDSFRQGLCGCPGSDKFLSFHQTSVTEPRQIPYILSFSTGHSPLTCATYLIHRSVRSNSWPIMRKNPAVIETVSCGRIGRKLF